MTVTVTVHNRARYHLLTDANWSTLDLRAALFVKHAWTPNPDDDFIVTATTAGAVELTAVGYARLTLSGQTTSLDDPNDRATGDANDLTFSGVAAAASYDTLCIFCHVTDDSDSWLAFTYSLGAQTSDGTNIVFQVNAAGVVALA